MKKLAIIILTLLALSGCSMVGDVVYPPLHVVRVTSIEPDGPGPCRYPAFIGCGHRPGTQDGSVYAMMYDQHLVAFKATGTDRDLLRMGATEESLAAIHIATFQLGAGCGADSDGGLDVRDCWQLARARAVERSGTWLRLVSALDETSAKRMALAVVDAERAYRMWLQTRSGAGNLGF